MVTGKLNYVPKLVYPIGL